MTRPARLVLSLFAVASLFTMSLGAFQPKDALSAAAPPNRKVLSPRVGETARVGNEDIGRALNVPGELVVKFKSTTDQPAVEEVLSRQGAKLKRKLPSGDHWLVTLPSNQDVSGLAATLHQNADIEIAEPNQYRYASFNPNDPLYSYQWNFPLIQGPAAWDISTGSGVIVAVVDTGIAYENYGPYQQATDFANTTFVPGWDFVDNDSHPNDDYGHGTHVAGTIAQSTNDAFGTAGIAYGARLMPVRVLDGFGVGTDVTVGDGIKWAVDHGAKVINLSLGAAGPSSYMESMVNYAHDHGVVVIAAAGNQNGAIEYPGACTNAISVGAIRYDQTRTYYSNYGPQLTLVAPGGDLNVDQNGDGYPDGILQQTFSSGYPTNFGHYFYAGTSMATPHVAAVAALLLSAGVAATPDQVRQTLQSTAKDLGEPGWDQYYGYGLVQAYDALRYSSSAPTATATRTPTSTPTVIPTATPTTGQNLALGRPVAVSSIDMTGHEGPKAVDGNSSTRWSSAYANNQWIRIDLGARYDISKVVLKWETAYGRSYLIQTSDDGAAWQTIYTRTGGTGGTETLTLAGTGRYVRMYGQTRGTQWGFSLWEFQVFGSPTNPGDATPTATVTATNTPTPTPTATAAVTDTPFPTPTGVATETPTPSPTWTATATSTSTAVPTKVATQTPTPPATLTATPTPPDGQNLALNRPVQVSSIDMGGHEGPKAVDGSLSTRWSSNYTNNQWIRVDLGARHNISKVVLHWEVAYGRSYQIQVSDDGSTWQTIYTRTGGTGGKETLPVSCTGRYVRMYGLTRGTQWGFSLWEFGVY